MADKKQRFLSKIGSALHKVEGVVTQFNPLVGLAVSAIASFLPAGSKEQQIVQAIPGEIQQGVSIIELFEAGGQALSLPGDQKLLMAAGPIAQIVLQSTAFAGKKIADPELFKQGANKIASGIADCRNAVDASEVKVQNLS